MILIPLALSACDATPPEDAEPVLAENVRKRQPQRQEAPKVLNSPLERAISRGMEPGGDLADELRALGDYPIRSREDAEVICDALGTLPAQEPDEGGFTSRLHALTGLFQDVDGADSPAFDVLYDEGLPQLIRIFDEKLQQSDDDDVDDLLFVLKILARYGSREGAEKVVEAARRPLEPDNYMWSVVLSSFSGGHPHGEYVFHELSDPLPSGFLGVALLDSANAAAIVGELERHPFDSAAGRAQLRRWLEDRDPEQFSYAHSATAALPFIRNPTRDQLLALAMDHVDAGVQMEAAWAAGRLGREAGLKVLARFCLDVNHSDVAQRYLAELGREDFIPAEAQEPAFRARAEFARWLAHPNELGQPPDELEVVDHRRLDWPPDREPRPFWLLRYRIRDRTGLEEDDVDCGLVGSITWCFFSYNMDQRPPEDVYAIHCYWEMEHAGLITETEVDDPAQYAHMLGQWRGEHLDSPQISRVAELSPALKVPGRVVALASASLDDEEGWVVLDGPRSAWYPKAEQPAETEGGVVLMIHVGRQLLGFQDQPDRSQFLAPDTGSRDPQRIIDAYEKLMAEAISADPSRREELLGSGSVLARQFDAYVDALVAVVGTPRPLAVIDVYRRFLLLTTPADVSTGDEILGPYGVLGQNFDKYVDALVSQGRSAQVAGVLEIIAPHWDHNLGYARLGAASFKADLWPTAESYLLKLRDGSESYHRFEEMSLLAEIWNSRGEEERARELLVDCLRKLITEIQESKYESDRQMLAGKFRHHRTTYLRLFPGGESELMELGIPDEAL